MSQFNKYLEIVQEQREYNYDDLEIYDEGFKELLASVNKENFKESFKKLIKYALILVMTASLGISLTEIDNALKREDFSTLNVITSSTINNIKKQSSEKSGKALTQQQISKIYQLVKDYVYNGNNKKELNKYFMDDLKYNEKDLEVLEKKIENLRDLYQKTSEANEKNYPSIIAKIKNLL
jgi:polyhydroxyalkanoate synthesis regulator phasin